jgi:WD40 repeat protein
MAPSGCVLVALIAVAGCLATDPTALERATIRPMVAKQIVLAGPNRAHTLSWSPDGRRISVGTLTDKRIGVYDVESGAKRPGPPDLVGGARELSHSPDGRYLAIAHGRMEQGGQSYCVSLWDPVTGAHIQSLVESWEDIQVFNAMALAFSPDSQYLAVAYQVGTFFYDVRTPGQARSVGRTVSGFPIAFSPTGRRLAVSARGVLLAEPPSGRIAAQAGPGVRVFGFSPDGQFFITSSWDGTYVYSLRGDDTVAGPRHVPHSQNDPVTWVSVSPDSRFVALAQYNRIRILRLSDLGLVATIADRHGAFEGASFSPDGSSLAVFGGSARVTIWAISPVR